MRGCAGDRVADIFLFASVTWAKKLGHSARNGHNLVALTRPR